MKKVIYLLILVLFIVALYVAFMLLKDKTVATVMLDINPSIKINIGKNNKVKSVEAISADAKKIISNNLKGKELDEALIIICENVISSGYADEKNVSIVLATTGDISVSDVSKTLHDEFDKREIATDIIVMDNITKEDYKLAKKYNINPSKAAYINSILKEKDIPVENLKDSSIKELRDTKETGRYCPEGYTLDGEFCIKEIKKIEARYDFVCPEGYQDYQGTCYLEGRFIRGEKYACNEDYVVEGNKCVRKEFIEADPVYECQTGELMRKGEAWIIGAEDNDKMVCVDKSTGVPPTQRCLLQNHIMIDGNCADGPKPTINGGCEPGDYLVNGGCYTVDNYDQWQCPNGGIFEKSKGTYVELCPDTFTYLEPTITGYTCKDDFILKDGKCVKEETYDAFKEVICLEGSTLVENSRCLYLDNQKEHEPGYICDDPHGRVEGSTCIIYDFVDALIG